MPWKCPVCGAENPDDADRCLVCGTPRPSETESLKLEEERPAGPVPVATEEEVVEEREEQIIEVGEVAQEAVQAETVAEAATAPAAAAEEAAAPAQPVTGRFVFVVVNTPAKELLGKKIPLLFETFGKISIGRSLENVVVVPDSTVSRRHAVVYMENGKLYIEDLGSTNGTYVYDKDEGVFRKVEAKTELKPGDLIRLGHGTILRVELEE